MGTEKKERELLVQHISGTFPVQELTKPDRPLPKADWILIGERWGTLTAGGSAVLAAHIVAKRDRNAPIEWHDIYRVVPDKTEHRFYNQIDHKKKAKFSPEIAGPSAESVVDPTKSHALIKLYPAGSLNYSRELRALLTARGAFAGEPHYRRHLARVVEAGAFGTIATCIDGHTKREDSVVVMRRGPMHYTLKNPMRYLVLESLNVNLAEIWAMATGRQPTEERLLAYRLTIGCMRAVRALHMMGYVARAISPLTFAVRVGAGTLLPDKIERAVVLCDLRHCEKIDVAPRASATPRPRSSIGSLYYMSLAAHHGEEATPVDDYISVVYMMIEWLLGMLPWAFIDDESAIVHRKRKFADTNNKQSKLYKISRSARWLTICVLQRKLPPFEKMERGLHEAIELEARKSHVDPSSLPIWLPAEV